MLRCGLLGVKLGHSFSPEIHALFGDYEYKLYEKSEAELESFFLRREFDGLNVTIPYKKTVIPYLDRLSPEAERIGSVNTVVNKEGVLYGYNTDCYGFGALLSHSKTDVKGKKALVLGSGGASAAVCAAIEEAGGSPVVVSRAGAVNYRNAPLQTDAEVIVNATPVGMYPENGKSPVDLNLFPSVKSVIDIIYNPARTALLLQAEKLGLNTAGGLYMLVAQAKRASELFTGIKLDGEAIDRTVGHLLKKTQNVILIGMPGSGKTAIAKELSAVTGRPLFDSDEYIEKKTGKTVPDIINGEGEAAFRRLESAALRELCKKSGAVISTGGGCVTVPENYDALHQNGAIVLIKRDISLLSRAGRPLSQGDIRALYEKRKPLYERFADITADNNSTPAEAARRIAEELL